MQGKHRLAAVAALFLGLACGQARGWDSVGHMAVAYSAYQQLTPVEQKRAITLLKKCPYYTKWVNYLPTGLTTAKRNQYIFMMAATWPDEIKAAHSGYGGSDTPPAHEDPNLNVGYTDTNAHKYWHFIDTPFSDDGTALPAVPQPTIVEKITAFRAALATSEKVAVKSYDLVWLLHLVGDVHQPLHCTTRVSAAATSGDTGGNDVILSGNPDELHAFWDDILGVGNTQSFALAETVGQALPTPDATAVADDNEADWAAESLALARSTAYMNPPVGPGVGPYTVTDDYTSAVKAVAEQRVALAGARLANLLKKALNCSSTHCAN